MTPLQLAALKTWLVTEVRRAPLGGTPVSFSDVAVFKGQHTAAPRTVYPLIVVNELASSRQGRGELLPELVPHVARWVLDVNPVAPFTVSISHYSSKPSSINVAPIFGVAVTPGVDALATATATVAALESATAPATRIANYAVVNTGGVIAVEATAVEVMRGQPLILSSGSSDLTVETTQEPYREIFRDLRLETLSIRVETRADDPPPPIDETSWQLAEKLLGAFARPRGIEDLLAVCVGFANASGPVATSMLSGNSQGVDVATITVRLNVTIDDAREQGTIETFEAAATIDAEGGALEVPISSP